MRLFTMSRQSLTNAANSAGRPIWCSECGILLVKGIPVVRGNTSRSRAKYYHRKCWEALWL